MLLKRSGIFYFRWQIPVELRPVLGRRELVKSLRTRDQLIAECRAAPFRLLVHRVKQQRSNIKVNDLTPEDKKMFEEWEKEDNKRLEAPSLVPVTDANLEQVLEKLWKRCVEEVTQRTQLKFRDLTELEAYKTHLESIGRDVQETLLTQAGSLEADGPASLRNFLWDCRSDLAALGYRLDEGGHWLEHLLSKYVKMQGAIVKQELANREQRVAELLAFPRDFAFCQTSAPQKSDGTPLFSEVYEKFLNAKLKRKPKPLSDSQQGEYRRFYDDWCDLMEDKPIGLYEKKDIKEFLEKLLDMPQRNKKRYKGKSASELLELDDIPEEDLVAPRSVGHVRKWLQGVFKYAEDEGITTNKPATGLKMNLSASKSYGRFTDSMVAQMLEFSKQQEGWRRWIIPLAAYTGMRRGEIVQLRGDDIRLDSESGRYYIRVTDLGQGQTLKTENARRLVPLHPVLEEGILELSQTQGEGRLFPSLKPKRVTDWFIGSVRNECSIPEANDFGKRLSFHSFRTTLISKLRASNFNDAQVQQLVGHQATSAGITDTYTDGFTVGELCKVVDSIKF